MKNSVAMWLAVAVFAALCHELMAIPSPTSPALLFSPHLQFSNSEVDEAVMYRTISSRDLAKSVASQGGWSNLMCPGRKVHQPVDVALVFVGRELISTDISGITNTDSSLVNLLKVSYSKSNFSMGYPYVTASTKESMENSLLTGFQEACGEELEASTVAFSESCTIDGEKFQKLAGVEAVHDLLSSRTEKRADGQTDLVVFCHGDVGKPQSEGMSLFSSRSEELDLCLISFHRKCLYTQLNISKYVGEVFSELISSVEASGARYSVLYVSNPFQSIQYPSQLGRFLSEDAARNGSLKSTGCDELCQIKASLLEGLLVGIVLLLILISGICCMMGIDSPARFETPQES
ncbi:hypothetical protein LINPERHAP1_LOCUS43381 [Linum perenne]